MTEDKPVEQKTAWEVTKEELEHYAKLIFKGKPNKARGYWAALASKYGFDPDKVYLDRDARTFRLGRRDLTEDEKIQVSQACKAIDEACGAAEQKVRELVETLKQTGNEVIAMKYKNHLATIASRGACWAVLYSGVEKELGTRDAWKKAENKIAIKQLGTEKEILVDGPSVVNTRPRVVWHSEEHDCQPEGHEVITPKTDESSHSPK